MQVVNINKRPSGNRRPLITYNFSNFFSYNKGQGLVEYALILSLLIIITIASMRIFNISLLNLFNIVDNAI